MRTAIFRAQDCLKRFLALGLMELVLLAGSAFASLADEIEELQNLDRKTDEIALPVLSATTPSFDIPRIEIEDWMKAVIDRAVAQEQLAGAGFVLVHPNGSVLTRGFGHANQETDEEIHPGVTYLPIAQLANLFLVDRLLEFQKSDMLDLDDPTSRFLTRLRLPSEFHTLTIRSLFGDHSGLGTSIRGSHQSDIARNGLANLKSMIEAVSAEAPQDGPSPLALALAAIVLEDVGGVPNAKAIKEIAVRNWRVSPWINEAGAPVPPYTSRHHRVSMSGKFSIDQILAPAPGFEASQGTYVTLSDLAGILSRLITKLESNDARTRTLASLTFRDTNLSSEHGSLHAFVLQGGAAGNAIAVLVIPDLKIATAFITNASAVLPETRAQGSDEGLSLLEAEDLLQSFQEHFIGPRIALSKSPENMATSTARMGSGRPGPDRILALLDKRPAGFASTTQAPSTTSGMQFQGSTASERDRAATTGAIGSAWIALALCAAILQFALLAAARWETTTTPQRMARWVGPATPVVLTAAMFLPVVLVLMGHSRSVIDPAWTMTTMAMPLAGVLVVVTVGLACAAWISKWWGQESIGLRRRVCFTVGAASAFILAVTIWVFGAVNLQI